MAETLQTYFAPPEDDEKRFERIEKALGVTPDGKFTLGLYGAVAAALADYRDYKRSGYQAWPFPGGKRNQPQWVIHNFETLELVEEYFELRRKLGRDPAGVEKLPASADAGQLFN